MYQPPHTSKPWAHRVDTGWGTLCQLHGKPSPSQDPVLGHRTSTPPPGRDSHLPPATWPKNCWREEDSLLDSAPDRGRPFLCTMTSWPHLCSGLPVRAPQLRGPAAWLCWPRPEATAGGVLRPREPRRPSDGGPGSDRGLPHPLPQAPAFLRPSWEGQAHRELASLSPALSPRPPVSLRPHCWCPLCSGGSRTARDTSLGPRHEGHRAEWHERAWHSHRSPLLLSAGCGHPASSGGGCWALRPSQVGVCRGRACCAHAGRGPRDTAGATVPPCSSRSEVGLQGELQ